MNRGKHADSLTNWVFYTYQSDKVQKFYNAAKHHMYLQVFSKFDYITIALALKNYYFMLYKISTIKYKNYD